MDTKQAVMLMADAAEAMGADAEDSNGAVRSIVAQHGLGFNAWFSVCCEIADRSARKQGYKDTVDRAIVKMEVARIREELV